MIICWCENSNIKKFSNHYSACNSCGTLITEQTNVPSNVSTHFVADNLYQTLFIIQHIIQYKLPPSNIITIGYDQKITNDLLEMLEYKSIEHSQNVACESKPLNNFDVLIYNSIEQNLSIKLLKSLIGYLQPNGILLLEFVNFPIDEDYGTLLKTKSPFLDYLDPEKYSYIYNQKSIETLLKILDIHYFLFEYPRDSQTGILIASREPLYKIHQSKIDDFLNSTRKRWFLFEILKLFNLYPKQSVSENINRINNIDLINQLNSITQSYALRLREWSGQLDAIRHLNLELSHLYSRYEESERDRAAQLEVIKQLDLQLQLIKKEPPRSHPFVKFLKYAKKALFH